MSEQTNELQKLEKLVGQAKIITVMVNGEPEAVKIQQIKTGQIPELVRVAGPVMLMIADRKQQLDLGKLMLLHTSECLDMLAILMKKDRAFVDELDLDDAVICLEALLEINIDFFVQRVLPYVLAALKKGKNLVAARETLQKLGGQTQPSS